MTQPRTTKRLTKNDVEIIQREPGFRGFFSVDVLSLRHRKYNGAWSDVIQREMFLRGDAVGVLLYDPVHDLVALVEQFRPGALKREQGPWLKEVVAGMLDPGKTPRQVAVKECMEEAGLDIAESDLEPILDFLVSPGGCDERFYLFCLCADLRDIDGVFGLESEHEDIRLSAEPYESIIAELDRGELDSSATVICLQWLQLNRERIKNEALSR